MKYRDRTTGQIYTLFELQEKYSNTSFPIIWSDDTFNYANVDPVTEVPQPHPTNAKYRVEFDSIQFVDTQWKEVWKEVPKFDDPAEQTVWETECVEIQWNNIRGVRDQLLRDTDYTDLPNTPITTTCRNNFISYRQELRNITSQTDPLNIVWPTQPPYETV